VERQYERVLGSKFIQVPDRSSTRRKSGIPTHEDVGFFSFDSPVSALCSGSSMSKGS
jgi:hypothetical protein